MEILSNIWWYWETLGEKNISFKKSFHVSEDSPTPHKNIKRIWHISPTQGHKIKPFQSNSVAELRHNDPECGDCSENLHIPSSFAASTENPRMQQFGFPQWIFWLFVHGRNMVETWQVWIENYELYFQFPFPQSLFKDIKQLIFTEWSP